MNDTVTQDVYIRAGNLKQGDRIIPWDPIINPTGKIIFIINDIVIHEHTVRMRIRNEDSVCLFNYRVKTEDKEVLVVLN